MSKLYAIDVFGMQIESHDLSEVADDIIRKSAGAEPVMVVTPNVDHFLRWQEDSTFRELYEHADFCLIDGMPILWLAKILSSSKSERITGIDLSLRILEKANKARIPISIIGGTDKAMEAATKKIKIKYPELEIYFTAVPSASELKNPDYVTQLSKSLMIRQQKIVLLCLGSPKQEQLYVDLISNHQITGAYLCVGGTIDFIAELKKRAPKFVQKIGFEWMYRFIQEPFRLFERYFVRDIFIVPYLARALVSRISKKLIKNGI